MCVRDACMCSRVSCWSGALVYIWSLPGPPSAKMCAHTYLAQATRELCSVWHARVYMSVGLVVLYDLSAGCIRFF